jgi:release factor glutamine methyltransferase
VRPLEAVRAVGRELAAAGVPDARADAEILVAHVLGHSRSSLYAVEGDLDEAQLLRLRSLVERRRDREPLQYVLGEWGFRRLTLAVDRRVLCPRPETEVVVERCLERLRDLTQPCVVGVDASEDALAVARENARRTGLERRVELVRGDLFAGLDGPFDLVVSNPPYVRADELPGLEPEVREHEPRAALVATGVTEAIALGARDVLEPGGWLVLECGDGQEDDVARLLRSLGYDEITATPDLRGVPRVVEGRTRLHGTQAPATSARA